MAAARLCVAALGLVGVPLGLDRLSAADRVGLDPESALALTGALPRLELVSLCMDDASRLGRYPIRDRQRLDRDRPD